MFNTLTEAVIRARGGDDLVEAHTLPGVMAGLARGEIASFPALRPHQRHVWHAFLVQLATLALFRVGRAVVPGDEETWRDLIRGLTPDWPDDEPWSLVVKDLSKPALLQPPVPPEEFAIWQSDNKNRLYTPDELDSAITTAKAHDLKPSILNEAASDDWLFALISFQTQTHYGGKGWYGAARTPQGFLNRSIVAAVAEGGMNRRFKDDLEICLNTHAPEESPLSPDPEKGITWLLEMNGKESLNYSDLHRFFIEANRICRLVQNKNCKIMGVRKSRDAPRIISKEIRDNPASLSPVIKDPWAAIERSSQGPLKFTLFNRTPDYKCISKILDPAQYDLPICGDPAALQASTGELVVAGIARDHRPGKGNSLGYHERAILVPKRIKSIFARREGRDEVAQKAQERVKALGELRGALRFGLVVLAQGGPDKTADKPTTNGFIQPWLSRFEAEVDRDFFPELWAEFASEAPQARLDAYRAWKGARRDHAEDLLNEASASLPLPVARRYRAKVKAMSAFHGRLRKSDAFKDTYFDREQETAA